MKSKSGYSQVRTLALGGLTGAMLVGLVQTQVQWPHPKAVGADSGQKIRQELGTFARLARDLKPSVVNILVEKVVEQPDSPFSFRFPGFLEGNERFKSRSTGQGSGVIVSSDGYIVTNNHVVEGVKHCKVTLSDGNELQGEVIGTDPKTDLALVRVKSTRPLPAANLGDSERLEVGDWVMAIGNPFGLEATVTVGVLSGKGRVIGAGPYDNFLQTDASINPGNSGGPLFNTDGQVVGINTAIVKDGQGIGFSIPINMAKDIVAQLKEKGRVVRGFLGVGIQPLSGKLRGALKIPSEVQGALISSLVSGGPAGKAGIQIQDVVTAVNGKAIHSDRELLAEIARTPVGSRAELDVWRAGKATHLSVPVVERPDDVASVAPAQDPSRDQALGLGVQELTPEVSQQLSSSSRDGVVVVSVESNSPAERAGLRRGDIIHRVNTTDVGNTQQFLSALKGAPSEALALLVERQGNTMFLTIDG